MLLTITSTRAPADELSFLLAKHPDKVQRFELSHGQAHVFYPEVSRERTTAALLLELDAVGLVRGKGDSDGTLSQYVNDRPYVASSFMSVAIAQVLGSALRGASKDRPDLVATPLPLEIRLSAVPSRGGEALLRRLFEPLGHQVEARRLALDELHPEWGQSRYYELRLVITHTLSAVLSHLYVLLPVLDDDKHYYIGQDELEKLLHHAGDWLKSHPDRELITTRYLGHFRSLVRKAMDRLSADETADADAAEEKKAEGEEALEERISLNEARLRTVEEEALAASPRSVIDLGCGEGKLLRRLMKHKEIERLVGVDVSPRSLEIAEERLKLERLAPRQRQRIDLIQGSLTYRDRRFSDFDVACLVEVIEHVDAERLESLSQVVFAHARPGTVLVTTPNVEHNVRFPGLAPGKRRHADHRFEWTRAEFQAWASAIAAQFGYAVRYRDIGTEDAEVGPPTQMAIFTRAGVKP
ncbi:MAG: 3' terminal RNA ribose 2'-O-methyltransferase Hen1 [Myxococcota bacterium]